MPEPLTVRTSNRYGSHAFVLSLYMPMRWVHRLCVIMRKLLLSLFFLVLLVPEMSAESIYMKIGETKKLSPSVLTTKVLAGQPAWTSSRPYDVKVVSFDMYSCTIEAAKSFSGFAVIHCLYYYRELDPVSGKYIYQRSGYVDYHVYVEDNSGSGNEGGNNGGSNTPGYDDKKIVLYTNSITIKEEETVELKVRSAKAKVVNWRVQDSSIAKITSINDGWTLQVKGLREGLTTLFASDSGGGTATCQVSVSKRTFTNGESINRIPSEEGVILGFEVTDVNRKECKLVYIDNPSNYNNISTITIPQRVYGLSVTAIGSSVFSIFTTKEKSVNMLLPETIREIENNAFSESPIRSISLPSSLKKIGNRAFMRSSIESINIPEGVTEIGEACFLNCRNLSFVNLPSTLRILPDECFRYCTNLSSINIPTGMEEIHYAALRNTILTHIHFPKSLKKIENRCLPVEKLTYIICASEIPCVCEGGVLWADLRIIVPVGAIQNYKNTEYWGMTEVREYGDKSSVVKLIQYTGEYYSPCVSTSIGDSKSEQTGIYESKIRDITKSDIYTIAIINIDSFLEYGTKSNISIFDNVLNWDKFNVHEYDLYPLTDNDAHEFMMSNSWSGSEVNVKFDYNQMKVAFSINGNSGNSAVDDITISNDNSTPVYYNLQGFRVINPHNGVFIKVVNGNATKVLLE